MQKRLAAMIKYYESKVIEAEDTIEKLLKSEMILPEHTSYFKEIDKWLSIKGESFSKLQHLSGYISKKEKDGK
tara:strand:+ start:701 stop:919 length:219 start_codon:yes stop_codon:yes gene_type:complete